MPSKMITDRQKACNSILSALRNAGPEAALHIQKLLSPELQPDETIPDLGLFLELLALHLEQLLKELLTADRTYQNERSDDPMTRNHRDEAFQALLEKASRYRGYARQLHGLPGERQILGVDGETARSPVPLLQQARTMISRLREPELVMPAPDPDFPSATIEPEAWASTLEALSRTLQNALQGVENETRETQAAWERRLQAMEAFDAAYTQVVSVCEASLFLGGLPEQAQRTRLRLPKRSAGAEEAEDAASAPEAQPAGDSGTCCRRGRRVARTPLRHPQGQSFCEDDRYGSRKGFAKRRGFFSQERASRPKGPTDASLSNRPPPASAPARCVEQRPVFEPPRVDAACRPSLSSLTLLGALLDDIMTC